MAGCQANLANSFHNLGGLDIVSLAEIVLHMAYVVYEPMAVMELVLFCTVILLCDLGLTKLLGSFLRTFDARI